MLGSYGRRIGRAGRPRWPLAIAVFVAVAVLGSSAHAGSSRLPLAGASATVDQSHGLAGTRRFDIGLHVAFCPPGSRPPGAPEYGPEAGPEEGGGRGRKVSAMSAGTSEAGWPAKECLKMDKGVAGRTHTLVGLNGVHNWLLGGYGNDTIIGGNHGDVIWADYHPNGEPAFQSVTIRAGNGRNVIYANDTRNYVWTGTNPKTVVHAHASGITGVIHCQSSGVVVFLSSISQRHFTLDGCRHISHYSVGY
jgi:hypothetical protein